MEQQNRKDNRIINDMLREDFMALVKCPECGRERVRKAEEAKAEAERYRQMTKIRPLDFCFLKVNVLYRKL